MGIAYKENDKESRTLAYIGFVNLKAKTFNEAVRKVKEKLPSSFFSLKRKGVFPVTLAWIRNTDCGGMSERTEKLNARYFRLRNEGRIEVRFIGQTRYERKTDEELTHIRDQIYNDIIKSFGSDEELNMPFYYPYYNVPKSEEVQLLGDVAHTPFKKIGKKKIKQPLMYACWVLVKAKTSKEAIQKIKGRLPPYLLAFKKKEFEAMTLRWIRNVDDGENKERIEKLKSQYFELHEKGMIQVRFQGETEYDGKTDDELKEIENKIYEDIEESLEPDENIILPPYYKGYYPPD